MQASVFVAASLDGFIARANGELDWLPGSGDGPEVAGGDLGHQDSPASADGPEDAVGDLGYADFMASVDVLVMGRRSFEKVRSFGQWPYEDKSVVVLSSKPVTIPDDIAGTVEWRSASPDTLVEQLAEAGAQHLYVDGGRTIQGFLRAGLIHQLVITTIPVLIGDGIPLFGPLDQDVTLHLRETVAFPNGFVQSRYEVGP